MNAQGDGALAHAAKYPPQELRKRVGLIEGTVEEFEGPGRASYEGVLATLPAGFSLEGKRILDFGCGAGRVLRHFIADRRRSSCGAATSTRPASTGSGRT